MDKPRILIVEDEPKMARLITEVLTAAGFEVLVTRNGAHAIEIVAMEKPDLILLDIILSAGNMDGYEVARRIREFSNLPVIMLTARVRESDLLRGFEAGADDYITKPFSSKELVARIRAVLKRCQDKEAFLTRSEIVCGDLRIDLARRRVTIGEREIYLTPTEYNLLHELARNSNKILYHEHLLTTIWGQEYRNDVDYLRSYIHYLRKKLEPDPANPRIIVTTPGIGYMLVVPDVDQSEPSWHNN